MRSYSSMVVVVGSLCLMVILVLAWCLAGVRSATFMKTLFPNCQYLLKAHIDYLLMTGLLMIFFLMFNHFRVAVTSRGVRNECRVAHESRGFLALAIRPGLRRRSRRRSPIRIVVSESAERDPKLCRGISQADVR
jgi:hypothetical protein